MDFKINHARKLKIGKIWQLRDLNIVLTLAGLEKIRQVLKQRISNIEIVLTYIKLTLEFPPLPEFADKARLRLHPRL